MIEIGCSALAKKKRKRKKEWKKCNEQRKKLKKEFEEGIE